MDRIGEYLVKRLIGEGGMGKVYEAEERLSKRRVALKVLRPELTRHEDGRRLFLNEMQILAHLEHPNLVRSLSSMETDGQLVLVLEYLHGRTLRQELTQRGTLPWHEALEHVVRIAEALTVAHEQEPPIVHRDLKPENVMLVERDGDPDFVKVLDFGIAKVQMGELGTNDREGPAQNVLTQAGMVYGTPEYMAPEQALGQPVDARADLYALGVIMYELLTGHRPFEAESKVALLGMQVTAPVPAMITKCQDCNVPLEVEVLVGRLLAKEASERIGDAKDVIENIGQILSALAGAGRIDARYAPPPASGFATNPGILSGITPAPDLQGLASNRPPPASADAPRVDGLLGGRGWLVAMGAGVLGLVVLVTAVVFVFRGRDGTNPSATDAAGIVTLAEGGTGPAGDPSTDERVTEAIAMIDRGDYGSGIKKLEDLGEATAAREDVHRALLNAYSATDRPKEAMREAGLVLKTNPNIALLQEVKFRVEVRDTALKEGSKEPAQKAAADEAFGLLENQMGTVGWDDVYDIAYGRSGRDYPNAAKRAQRALAKGERAKMSPPLQVAMDLHGSGTASCAFKSHLERAQKEGDERSLVLLQQIAALHKPTGNRRVDRTNECFNDGAVAKGITAMEQRLRKK